MCAGRVVILICGLGFLCFVKSATAQYYDSYRDLETACNESLTVVCPYMYTGRAGTFRYYYIGNLPAGRCSFNVTLDSNCGTSASNQFAFYFNIRKFILPSEDTLTIYQTRDSVMGNSSTMIKKLTGYLAQSYNPTSVAQARTAFSRQPSFTFEYFRSSSPYSGLHEAYIDFVIVESTSHIRNAFCAALGGYVHDDFICDKDGLTDRVNCPSSFSPSITGRNPALWRQCQTASTTPYYWDRSTRYWNNNNNYDYEDDLSAGAITGITVGVVFFVILIIYSLCFLCLLF
ncbi:uncharacterized protein LOC129596485 [Paramacrobiotus metropolitanus]|uniref:uncharacterized protein LOC129596485 n=1 Tax=Paramacrobiotus metropolitanus TaxID=2943436 RepID=UPI002445782E|nr:uncharacterized protein LOC129596485 [Paramacrobiotus metropolitanus]